MYAVLALLLCLIYAHLKQFYDWKSLPQRYEPAGMRTVGGGHIPIFLCYVLTPF